MLVLLVRTEDELRESEAYLRRDCVRMSRRLVGEAVEELLADQACRPRQPTQ